MDTPEEIKRWRGAIQAELAKLGKARRSQQAQEKSLGEKRAPMISQM